MKRGRKRHAIRADHFESRAFYRGSPQEIPDSRELLEALDIAEGVISEMADGGPAKSELRDAVQKVRGWYVEAGYAPSERLRDDLLRLHRAQAKEVGKWIQEARLRREHEMPSGSLSTRTRAELLRHLRAWRRRMDSLAICSQVNACALEGLPIAKSAGRKHDETAFEAVARCWRDRGWAYMSAANVERIYRVTMGADQ